MNRITITHDHPLVLDSQEQGGMGHICFMCKKALYRPLISCDQECGFFVHKTCAELPKEIQHPSHSQHHLFLHMSSPHKEGVNVVYCDGCGEKCEGSVYNCSNCDFNLDLICAFEERKIVHSSHKHPLFLVHKKMVFNCDACFREKSDSCYLCVTCQYSIHKHCAHLPGTIIVAEHGHPLSLVYSLRDFFIGIFFLYCDFCLKPFGPDIWSYFCYKCKYVAHLDCAISPAELSRDIRKIEAKADGNPRHLLRLPLTTDLDLIQYFVTKMPYSEVGSRRSRRHDHLLSFHSEEAREPKVKLTCEACELPISSSSSLSSSFCSRSPRVDDIPHLGSARNCFVHEVCSRLPSVIRHPSHRRHPLHLFRGNSIFSLYMCVGCGLVTNGLLYECRHPSCKFSLDVKCASLPSTILHDGHKHPLDLRGPTGREFFCRACCELRSGLVFECRNCAIYSVCLQCLQLSRFTSHRWDEHRLTLIRSKEVDHPAEFICEICEYEIHPQSWFYHCAECDNSFHPLCMPQYDSHSNVIFGGVLPHKKHPHPLQFRRRSKIRHPAECKCCGDKGGGPIYECTQGCDLGICQPCIIDHRWK